MKNRITLAVARTEFIDRQEDLGRSIHTIRVYNGLLRRLVRDLGDIQLVNISNKHIETWIFGLRKEHRTQQNGKTVARGIGPSTFNQTVSNLRVFFKWCQGQGYMRHNPTVNLSMLKVPKRTRQSPSAATLLQMLEVATFPRDRAYLATAMHTGLRQSEILLIQIRDVDLATGFICVVIPKTGEVDDQPITKELNDELRRWMTTYAQSISRSLHPDDFLFPTTTSPRIESRANGQMQFGPRELVPERPARRMEGVVQASMAALGLDTHYEGTHTIRRAAARVYYDAVAQVQGDVGALRETATFLHHGNLQTTERYLSMTPEKNRRDKRLKGMSFLTPLVDQSNVVDIKIRTTN